MVRPWCAFRILTSTRASHHKGVHFSTSKPPKVVRTCVFHILTWRCVSRHKGVHFFDISTSKSGRSMVCFVHFDLEMCFAPQRRALLRHLNFQKWSEHVVFFQILTWKTAASRFFSTFSHTCIFFLLTLSLL